MIDSIKYVGLWLTKHFGLLCNSKCSMRTVLSISVICSYHYGWYFAFLSIDNWIEQYWHPYTGLQILALGTALYRAPFQRFTLCRCCFFWRRALLLHSCLQPPLRHTSITGCGGYRKDLRITIKDFLGKCQVQPWHELTTVIWPGLHVIIMTSWATCIRASRSRRS